MRTTRIFEPYLKSFEYAANAHNLKVLEDTIRIIRRMKDLDNGRGDFPGKENLPRQAVVMLQDIEKSLKNAFPEKEFPHASDTAA